MVYAHNPITQETKAGESLSLVCGQPSVHTVLKRKESGSKKQGRAWKRKRKERNKITGIGVPRYFIHCLSLSLHYHLRSLGQWHSIGGP